MSITTMKIKYVEESVRADWTTLEDVSTMYSESEMVEMIQRYLDTQKHAIAYRVRSQVKQKMMKERLAELEAKLADVGE